MAQKIYSNRYKANSGFIKQLKRLDSRLGCRYREDLERFVITWEKYWSADDEIMVVSKPFFRQPDSRELMFLCSGDLHRTDMREQLEKSAAYFDDYRKKQDDSVKDEIRNMTKDDSIQLRNAFREVYNTGGKPSAFRRITPKKRGRPADELQNCVAQ